MSVYPGFGVNYKNVQANWAADRNYFNLIGLNSIRTNPTSLPVPWSAGNPASAGSYAYWRFCAQTFHNNGFWVASGPPNGGTLNNNNVTQNAWSAYETAVLSEAAYLVANDIVFDTFTFANEMAAARYNPLAITQSGGVATAVTSSQHNFTNGQNINIFGANISGYNGNNIPITVINAKTFTYSVSPSLPTLVSGAKAYDMSLTQYIANIMDLAGKIKAVSGWTMPVSVDEYNYKDPITQQFTYTAYINNGLGNLDLISIHPYGNINLSTQTVAIGGFTYIQEMIEAFGEQCYISEFNLDSTSSNLSGLNPVTTVSTMQSFLQTYIFGNNVSRFIAYEWCEELNNRPTDYGFAQLKPNGDMNPMWFTFFESNPTEYDKGHRPVGARSSVSRNSVNRTTPKRPLFNTS